MNRTLLLQQVLNGLAIGSVYAIFALGYTLIFSVLRIINFTHGAIFTLGAYATYALTGSQFGINGLLAGATLPFTLVSSLGVAVALVNVTQYLFGAEPYSYPDPLEALPAAVNFGTASAPVLVRTVQVVIFGVSMVVLVLLTYLMNATRTGKALRAVAEDTTTSSLLGIDTDRLVLLTFVISGFLGGVTGTLIGLSVGIAGPYFGIAFGLKGLAVIVLGGLGDIPGAVVGGLLIGLAEAFVPAQYIAYREAMPFALLFIVLLVRPQGLLGRAQVQKV
ncbi:MAG: flagellar biosynthesis protein FlgM [Cyanobacteria bacterium 13_1_20CM_4_61_6]|nr:MAG: flagellar biosynthesis protein FlgM [Cyanobacteria bacterium 13_1_20CM_4_61_6]